MHNQYYNINLYVLQFDFFLPLIYFFLPQMPCCHKNVVAPQSNKNYYSRYIIVKKNSKRTVKIKLWYNFSLMNKLSFVPSTNFFLCGVKVVCLFTSFLHFSSTYYLLYMVSSGSREGGG